MNSSTTLHVCGKRRRLFEGIFQREIKIRKTKSVAPNFAQLAILVAFLLQWIMALVRHPILRCARARVRACAAARKSDHDTSFLRFRLSSSGTYPLPCDRYSSVIQIGCNTTAAFFQAFFFLSLHFSLPLISLHETDNGN